MKFKSEVLTQASGSIGGVTYSHNRGGMYRRARAIPTDPNSAQQVAVRMYLQNAANSWTTILTPAQRAAWETYAENTPVVDAMGDALLLTGQQMYIRSYVPGVQAGVAATVFATAPIVFNTGNAGALAIATASAATHVITGTIAGAPEWAGNDNGNLLILVSRPQNPSKNFFKGPFRFAAAFPGDTATPITAFLFDTDTIAGPEFAFSAGQKVFICVRALQADGRLSFPMILPVIAGA
jgi:hypothetical protein